VDADSTPGADVFRNATLASFVDTFIPGMTAYTYYLANEQAFSPLGMAMYIEVLDSLITVPIETNRPSYQFPIRYGDQWDLFVHSNAFDQETYDTIHFNVDAWGTITDVAGSFNCLRVHLFEISLEISEGDAFRTTTHEYIFLAERFGAVMTLTGPDNDDVPDFQSGSFERLISIYGANSVTKPAPLTPAGIVLNPAFPNPFNPSAEISYSLP